MAGQLKASKQPELAHTFMQFVMTQPFQKTIATGNWMYPATRTALPEGFNTLTVPATSLQFSPQDVATQRSQWISAWQRAVSR
ncbi:MAG TPA: thiamine-binding periplasmic protein Flags: Precursor [Erwinia persicina]|nr:thiamine-binding periplasmic protein Flags: Precursor [Erwinia persicina]HBT31057.1 thiamine-binding periplasmic protein Flags: Precursor [Erwinia persicina]